MDLKRIDKLSAPKGEVIVQVSELHISRLGSKEELQRLLA